MEASKANSSKFFISYRELCLLSFIQSKGPALLFHLLSPFLQAIVCGEAVPVNW